jgi:cytochrome c biogenesis protein ResB
MKPFSINRNSWHYKLNKHFFNEDAYDMRSWERRRNNFCSYWRATLFRVIFLTALVAAASTAIGMLGYYIYTHTAQAIITIGGILAGVAVMVGIPITLIVLAGKIKHSDAVQNSIVLQRIRNHKSKICPSVEYK